MHKSKLYPIERSPLFELSNKNRLADLLAITRRELNAIAFFPVYYVFDHRENGKVRRIEDPNPRLKHVQKKLNRLLSKIETPSFLMSGKKGRSFVDNAAAHKGGKHIIKVDIQSFYRSARREYVFRAFKNIFRMSEDVAWVITDLVTYDEFLPTGAPTSQQIAYWAYAPMFHRLHRLAESQSTNMSLYVDDLTFSGCAPFGGGFVDTIQEILSSVGLRLNPGKTCSYKSKEFKFVTGCAISASGDLRVANKQRKKIYDLLQGRDIRDLDRSTTDRLLGLLSSARQVERYFYENMYMRSRKHQRALRAEAKTAQKVISS